MASKSLTIGSSRRDVHPGPFSSGSSAATTIESGVLHSFEQLRSRRSHGQKFGAPGIQGESDYERVTAQDVDVWFPPFDDDQVAVLALGIQPQLFDLHLVFE